MSIQTIGLKFDAGDLNRGVQASNQTLDSLGASAKRTGESVDQMIARMKASNLAQIQAAETAGRAGNALQDMGSKAASAASSTGLVGGALGLLARGGAIIIAVETGMKVVGAVYDLVAAKSIALEAASKKASDSLREQAERNAPAVAKAYANLNLVLERQAQLQERLATLDKVSAGLKRFGFTGSASVVDFFAQNTRDELGQEKTNEATGRKAANDGRLQRDADLVRLFAESKKLGTDTVALAAQAEEASKRLRAVVGDMTETVERRNEAQKALNALVEKSTKTTRTVRDDTDQQKNAIERLLDAQQKQLITLKAGADAFEVYDLVMKGATDTQIQYAMRVQQSVAALKALAAVDKANPIPLTPTVRGDNSRGLYNPVVGTGPDTRVEVKASADFFTETWQRAAFDVGRTLTDTFRAFFDGTKSAMETLLDGLASIASSFFGAAVNAGIGSLIKAPVLHGGGVVGSAGGSRSVSPMLFAGARRYHTGGMAGLAPDEVPAILQRGEMVIPRGGSMARESAPSVSVVLNVSSLDPVTARDLLLREMPTILKSVGDAASRSRMYRAQLQGG